MTEPVPRTPPQFDVPIKDLGWSVEGEAWWEYPGMIWRWMTKPFRRAVRSRSDDS